MPTVVQSADNIEQLPGMSGNTGAGTEPLAALHDDDFVSTADPTADMGAEGNFHGFELIRKLGSGGMGDVYLATDLELDCLVAIKMAKSMEPEAQALFLQEARSLAQVTHPNVVPILRLDTSGDFAYFAMQYVEGHDVARLVKAFREHRAHERSAEQILHMVGIQPVDLPRPLQALIRAPQPYYKLVAAWIAGAAEGLQAAHDKGLLHRDIKPANLLLTTHAQMVVVDFGLARPFDERSSHYSSGVTGTYPYTAPEKALGDWAAVDHRADIWALGATLYELLAYRRAYARDGKNVLVDITTRDPDVPHTIVSQVPRELETMCLKAMQRDPAQRYATAAEMADDLHAWLGQRRPPHKKALALSLGLAVAAALGITQYDHLRPAQDAQAQAMGQFESTPSQPPTDVPQPVEIQNSNPPQRPQAFEVNAPRQALRVAVTIETDAQTAESWRSLAGAVSKKFQELNHKRPDSAPQIALTFGAAQPADYQIVGQVSALFDELPENSKRFGPCTIDVSFELYQAGVDDNTWIPLQDRVFNDSGTFRILPNQQAVRDKTRGLIAPLIHELFESIIATEDDRGR